VTGLGQLDGRGLGWLVFFGAILGAWIALLAMVRADPASGLDGLPEGVWASLCLPAGEARFLPLMAMWALMGAAMMLPGFVPALATFRDLAAAGAGEAGASAALVAGYLAVWLAAAAVGAGAQSALAGAALLNPGGALISPLASAGLLIVAGLYQFSGAKSACLSRCRHPLTYFLGRWRPGARAAFGMGAELGLVCLGCCWALMALAFVGGTMNLMWMGLATLFMAAEKLPEIGRPLTRPAGIGLILAGTATLTAAAV